MRFQATIARFGYPRGGGGNHRRRTESYDREGCAARCGVRLRTCAYAIAGAALIQACEKAGVMVPRFVDAGDSGRLMDLLTSWAIDIVITSTTQATSILEY